VCGAFFNGLFCTTTTIIILNNNSSSSSSSSSSSGFIKHYSIEHHATYQLVQLPRRHHVNFVADADERVHEAVELALVLALRWLHLRQQTDTAQW
jgi:hypothetical protein